MSTHSPFHASRPGRGCAADDFLNDEMFTTPTERLLLMDFVLDCPIQDELIEWIRAHCGCARKCRNSDWVSLLTALNVIWPWTGRARSETAVIYVDTVADDEIMFARHT